MLEKLRSAGFDIRFTYHAGAILLKDFPKAIRELEALFLDIAIPIEELIRGGGGEAQVTQRLRRALHGQGWKKGVFNVEKKINERTTFAQSHEVDHVKHYEKGTIALEIEWNNKDPFFDRDLENFGRLHADGAISVGGIITRGASLQDGLGTAIRKYAVASEIASFNDLKRFNIDPTRRQKQMVEKIAQADERSFAEAWARAFMSDKFGAATTHWSKLETRLDRGVGSPCPLVAIGIPLSCVTGIPNAKNSK
ncbi:MAG: restriction endonuclease [Rhodospirillales bacterium]|nr:restriction endonuclease [Rhodospirillales bacterium]